MVNFCEELLEELFFVIFEIWLYINIFFKVYIFFLRLEKEFRVYVEYIDLEFIKFFLYIVKKYNYNFDIMIESK